MQKQKEKHKENYLDKLNDFLDSGTKKANIAKVALCVLAVASVPVIVFGAAAMGNAVQVFKMFNSSKRYSNKQIWSAMQNIKRQRLVEYVREKDGRTIVRITKKGETRLRSFAIDLIEIKKPKSWDGKWRIVLYDLPVRFTKGREALRYHIKDLGFYQFQKSAWVCPYPCEDEIVFIADFFGVGKFVEVLTVESILRDEKLKKYFGL